MRVLITGATGFIGGALARALLARGHELVCAVRDPARQALGQGAWQALAVDLGDVPSAPWWRTRLVGIDAVVNAVGIIRETSHQTFDELHARAPAELFRAAAEAGVPTVIQVSALGADETARSRYHRSKKVADDVLRALPLAGAIVQPSLVWGPGGGSATLFHTLAAAPVLGFPQGGRMLVQPVHADDVVDGIVRLLEAPPPHVETIAFVGARPLPMRDYLRELRAGLGIPGRQWLLPLPTGVFMAGAHLAARLPGSVLDAETAGMLLRGNAAPAAAFAALLGRAPRDAARFVEPSSAPMLRAQAVLGVWQPVLRVALALMWIWSAIVSFGAYPIDASLGLLGRVGLHGASALVALYGAAMLDLLLGVLTLACPPRWRRTLWAAQALLIAGYTVLVSLFLPEYWLHPYGPISKNVPILAAIGLLWALEPRRAPAPA